jgi:nucleotide-binding universal stress UspA family protein
VLLIRPDTPSHATPFSIKTVLAPVDGDPVHEQGLAVAADLARALGARLQLLSVVPTVGALAGRDATTRRFMPGTTQAILALAEEDLKSYLMRQVSSLQKTGLAALAELRHGDTASVIAEAAENIDAGAIVLATHGRAGTAAFWTNSVGARVQAQTKRPLFLVPVSKKPVLV